MTTLQRFKAFPPILVRLLARHKGGRPLTDEEIARAAGLDRAAVTYVSTFTRWDGKGCLIFLYEAYAFCKGCGLDMDDKKAWRRVDDYLRKVPTFRYLRASKDWEAVYKPMLLKWKSNYVTTSSGSLDGDTSESVPLLIHALLLRLKGIKS